MSTRKSVLKGPISYIVVTCSRTFSCFFLLQTVLVALHFLKALSNSALHLLLRSLAKNFIFFYLSFWGPGNIVLEKLACAILFSSDLVKWMASFSLTTESPNTLLIPFVILLSPSAVTSLSVTLSFFKTWAADSAY